MKKNNISENYIFLLPQVKVAKKKNALAAAVLAALDWHCKGCGQPTQSPTSPCANPNCPRNQNATRAVPYDRDPTKKLPKVKLPEWARDVSHEQQAPFAEEPKQKNVLPPSTPMSVGSPVGDAAAPPAINSPSATDNLPRTKRLDTTKIKELVDTPYNGTEIDIPWGSFALDMSNIHALTGEGLASFIVNTFHPKFTAYMKNVIKLVSVVSSIQDIMDDEIIRCKETISQIWTDNVAKGYSKLYSIKSAEVSLFEPLRKAMDTLLGTFVNNLNILTHSPHIRAAKKLEEWLETAIVDITNSASVNAQTIKNAGFETQYESLAKEQETIHSYLMEADELMKSLPENKMKQKMTVGPIVENIRTMDETITKIFYTLGRISYHMYEGRNKIISNPLPLEEERADDRPVKYTPPPPKTSPTAMTEKNVVTAMDMHKTKPSNPIDSVKNMWTTWRNQRGGKGYAYKLVDIVNALKEIAKNIGATCETIKQRAKSFPDPAVRTRCCNPNSSSGLAVIDYLDQYVKLLTQKAEESWIIMLRLHPTEASNDNGIKKESTNDSTKNTTVATSWGVEKVIDKLKK